MEITEPEHRGEHIEYIYANDKRLIKMIPKDKTTGWIFCQCEWGDTCPNNPNKQLVGSFQVCGIQIKKPLDITS